MNSSSRKRCGHCDKILSNRVFKRHKQWYFNDNTRVWKREIESSSADSDANEEEMDDYGNLLTIIIIIVM